MTSLLIDSHALIWLSTDDVRLSDGARDLVLDSATELFLSAATVWELAIKKSLGKLELEVQLADYLEQQRRDLDFQYLPIRPRDALLVQDLPFHHRDPFDRLLVAQAQANDLVLLTADRSFRHYDVQVAW